MYMQWSLFCLPIFGKDVAVSAHMKIEIACNNVIYMHLYTVVYTTYDHES